MPDHQLTPLEQYKKAAQEEYLVYSRACLQSDLLVVAGSAALYAWLAEKSGTFPKIIWRLGPSLVVAGFVRGSMLGKSLHQLREYLARLEAEAFKDKAIGWQTYRHADETLFRKHKRVALIFWFLFFVMNVALAAYMCFWWHPHSMSP